MARIITSGLDYGPLSKDFFNDLKVKKLRRKNPIFPYVYVTLVFDYVYPEGYYIKYDEDLLYDLADTIGIDTELCHEAINAMLAVNLINAEYFDEFGIVTSHGIQMQYERICKQSRKSVSIEKYSLLCNKNVSLNAQETPIPVQERAINVQERAINVARIPQSKVKKSKVKKSKENYYSSFILPYDFASPEEVEESEEEKQQKDFLTISEIFFFKNFAHPQEQARKFLNWNNLSGIGWDKMTDKQKAAAIDSWAEEPKQSGRTPKEFLPFWHKVITKFSDLNTSPELITKALDERTTVFFKNDRTQLYCHTSVMNWIEDNVQEFRPIFRDNLKAFQRYECFT